MTPLNGGRRERRAPCEPVREREVTLEVNPDRVDVAHLEALRRAGVTRLSMGVQSFDDEALRKAVRSQRPVVHAFPRSRSAQSFKNLAKKADTWPVPGGVSGHLQFFVERLIQYSSQIGEI